MPLPLEITQLLEFFIRWALLILAFFYVLFAVMVIRQIAIMRQTLVTSFSPILTLLGLIHLAVALGVLFLFATIL